MRHVLQAAVLLAGLTGPFGAAQAQVSVISSEKRFEDAMYLFNNKLFRVALVKFHDLANAEPDNEPAWHMLGTTHLRLDEYQEARDALDHAISVKPTVNAYMLETVACFRLADYPCIDEKERLAIGLNPQDSQIYQYITEVKAELGQYHEALTSFAEHKRLGGNDQGAMASAMAVAVLLRHMEPSGVQTLPPPTWQPKQGFRTDGTVSPGQGMLRTLIAAHLQYPRNILGETGYRTAEFPAGYVTDYIAVANRFRLAGSEASPIEVAPGFSVWNATIIFDLAERWGLFLDDGTHFKISQLVDGKIVERKGFVRRRQFEFE